MDGYGKPGYTREEFEREMDAELDAVSSLDRGYQSGSIRSGQNLVDEFLAHMAAQDPERLEADRAAAWGADRTTEK